MAVRCKTCGLVAYWFGLVLIAVLCFLSGVFTLTVDGEPSALRFLGFMTGVGLAGLCAGMIALVMRPPPG